LFIKVLTRKVLDVNPAINDFVMKGYQEGLKYEPSPLEKDPELKQFALEQTPWIDDAKSDRFSYFDPKELTPSIVSGLNRLKELQLSDGGWPWYKGMRSNAYVTAYILNGLARLEKDGALNMRSYPDIKEAMFKGLGLLMNEMKSDFERIRNREQNNLTSFSILSLYTYSYFRDWNIPEKCKPAYEYYLNQSAKYWKECSLEQEGMLALALNRLGKKEAAQNILTSIREHALIKGSGMYWATNRKNWFSSNIDVQALMIETFDELAKDQKAIDQMTYWLLEQKRTQAWNTSKETASALSALLCRGKVVSESRPLRVTIKGKEVSPDLFIGKPGYLKMEVKSSDLKSIEITNPNSTQAWGGVYVMQKVPMTQNAEHGTDIRLKKELFLVQSANESVMVPLTDSLKLMPGDRVRVRLIIQSGRDLEFVSLLDPRGAGFEPASQLSEYRWKSGIGYYFTQTDTDTRFFLSDVPVGTHVLEYDLIVAHKGAFSTGLARIECMYAPEFSSYSGGSLLKTN
ncbi:MAG: hypothetical protein Q8859_12965, partial [Bacteroidota bacterium]|nr:hypothetical protein [Bacteroidota bacterium]